LDLNRNAAPRGEMADSIAIPPLSALFSYPLPDPRPVVK
jgi:hypothetical protein